MIKLEKSTFLVQVLRNKVMINDSELLKLDAEEAPISDGSKIHDIESDPVATK